MKSVKKIGRSGVELHEVKRHVTLDDSTVLPSKPQSNYQPRKVKGGIDHPRAFFPGIGEFVPESKRKLPKLTEPEKGALSLIFHKNCGHMPIGDVLCNKLRKKELVFWTTGHWATTWKGDAYFK
jgi:hypothetical protein